MKILSLFVAFYILLPQHFGVVDISPFLKMGCKRITAEERDHLDCRSNEIEKKYSCLEIREVPQYFSSLTPNVPVVECVFTAEGIRDNDSEYVQYKGCGMLPVYNKYLTYYNGEIKELKNAHELKKFFAPVESSQEALALASALSGDAPLYELTIPAGFVKMTDTIVPTYSKSNGENYEVRLFGYACEGCGTHPYFFITYEVTANGDLKELHKDAAYRDPKEDNRCQD